MPQRAIIAGGGSIGSRVATILGDYGHDPVMIEQDADRCDLLQTVQHGPIIHGDATQAGILEQAGPRRADLFAALTGEPETNHALCRRIKARPGSIRTIARGMPSHDFSDNKNAVDEVVRPAAVGAKAVVNAMVERTQHLYQYPAEELDFVELTVAPGAPVAARDVADISFPTGCIAAADTEAMQVAGPTMEFRPGGEYLLATEPGVADGVRTLFRGV